MKKGILTIILTALALQPLATLKAAPNTQEASAAFVQQLTALHPAKPIPELTTAQSLPMDTLATYYAALVQANHELHNGQTELLRILKETSTLFEQQDPSRTETLLTQAQGLQGSLKITLETIKALPQPEKATDQARTAYESARKNFIDAPGQILQIASHISAELLSETLQLQKNSARLAENKEPPADDAEAKKLSKLVAEQQQQGQNLQKRIVDLQQQLLTLTQQNPQIKN